MYRIPVSSMIFLVIFVCNPSVGFDCNEAIKYNKFTFFRVIHLSSFDHVMYVCYRDFFCESVVFSVNERKGYLLYFSTIGNTDDFITCANEQTPEECYTYCYERDPTIKCRNNCEFYRNANGHRFFYQQIRDSPFDRCKNG
jgi:hypothetical protein